MAVLKYAPTLAVLIIVRTLAVLKLARRYFGWPSQSKVTSSLKNPCRYWNPGLLGEKCEYLCNLQHHTPNQLAEIYQEQISA